MSHHEKKTSKEVADKASDVMRDGRTADESKSAAASALSQAGEGGEEKNTSSEAARDASEVMRRDDTSPKSKSAAASALSQAGSDDKNS
jgi:hypothetical protein